MSLLDTFPADRAAWFWARVDRQEPVLCWAWTGVIDADGYGLAALTVDGRQRVYKAHRLALHLSGVDVPGRLLALHSCGHPACCNPHHLRVGDQAENMRDRAREGKYGHRKTRRHAAAEVLAMREMAASGASFGSVARAFGIDRSAARRICTGATYRQVGGPRTISAHGNAGPSARRTQVSSEIAEQLRRQYEAGRSFRDLRLEHGVPEVRVREAILQAGGTIRPQTRRPRTPRPPHGAGLLSGGAS